MTTKKKVKPYRKELVRPNIKKVALGLATLVGTIYGIKKGKEYLERRNISSKQQEIPKEIPKVVDTRRDKEMEIIRDAIRNIRYQINKSGKLRMYDFDENGGLYTACNAYNKVINFINKSCQYSYGNQQHINCLNRQLNSYLIDIRKFEENAKILKCI